MFLAGVGFPALIFPVAQDSARHSLGPGFAHLHHRQPSTFTIAMTRKLQPCGMTDSNAKLMPSHNEIERYEVKMQRVHDAINVCKALLIKHNRDYVVKQTREVKPSAMSSVKQRPSCGHRTWLEYRSH